MHPIAFRPTPIALVLASAPLLAACGSSSAPHLSPSSLDVDAEADAMTSDDGGSPPADDASADAPDAPPPAVSCDAFCASMEKNCVGTNTQFNSRAHCMAVCGALAAGTYGDSGNTIGCRQAHADSAAGRPLDSATYDCFAAGAFGAGTCASRCESFCADIVARCTGASKVYDTVLQCMGDCGFKFEVDNAEPEYVDAGNSLNCREYWLFEALDPAANASDLAARCANAGPSSAACK